jgi:2'-5' RNA ligase
MSKRMFMALELPEVCRTTLACLAVPIRGVRWLPVDQLHLTLAFLGEVDATAEKSLRERLAGVQVPPFYLPIKGVGTFGGARPSVIWAGVGSGHPHLYALHKHLHDALFAAGLDPELRAFHPHVTLARAKEVSAATLRPFLREHETDDFCLLRITGFTLFSSDLGPRGARHTAEMHREFSATART